MGRERVLEAVKKRWPVLGEVGEAAVRRDGSALEHRKPSGGCVCHPAGLRAVQQDERALKHATEALRADREVVLAAVQVRGFGLKHASEAVKRDVEVVLTAVQKNPHCLEFAVDDLRILHSRWSEEGVELSSACSSSPCCQVTAQWWQHGPLRNSRPSSPRNVESSARLTTAPLWSSGMARRPAAWRDLRVPAPRYALTVLCTGCVPKQI
eukprot:6278002-Amphidinium_carterae.1